MADYLLEVDAWTGASVETLRFATMGHATLPTDTPADTYYEPRIKDLGMMERSLFADGATSGAPQVGYGALELVNTDGGLDRLLDYGFDGRRVRLRDFRVRSSVAAAPILFEGLLADIDAADAWNVLRLKVADRLAELEKPLLTTRYAGTTTKTAPAAEGDLDLQGRMKPVVWGRVQNIPPVLANRFDLIYQVSARPVAQINVYDGGLLLINAGDYPTLPALHGASIARGAYATCLSLGLFRLGGGPALTLTADVAEGAPASRSAARVAERILDEAGLATASRVTSTFDALHAANGGEIGVFVDGDASALQVLSEVLGSVGAAIVPNALGAFEVVALSDPVEAPVATFGMRDLIGKGAIALASGSGSEKQGVPVWRVVVNYGRVWQTMSAAEILGAVDPARAAYLHSPWRQAVVENSSIKTAHPAAVELTVHTLLVDFEAALARANELLALHGTRRNRLRLTLNEEIARPAIPGKVVSLAIPRFGFDNGKPFRVIGRHDDWRKRQVHLTVWG